MALDNFDYIKTCDHLFEKAIDTIRERIGYGTPAGNSQSFVELQPITGVVDKKHPNVLENPQNYMISRIRGAMFGEVLYWPAGRIDALEGLANWQKVQVRKLGYAVTALPALEFVDLPQGRRQLSEAEQVTLASLRVWTYALLDEIAALWRDNLDNGSRRIAGDYSSHYAMLAGRSKALCELADLSHAGRRKTSQADDDDASETVDNVIEQNLTAFQAYIDALANEGRKETLNFSEWGNPRPIGGNALKSHIHSLALRAAAQGSGASPLRLSPEERLNVYIDVLDLLARARYAAHVTMTERPRRQKDFRVGLERLDGTDIDEVLADLGGHGKRKASAAHKARRAQTAEEFVRPPTYAPDLALTAADLGMVAFLCDVDPYIFIGQHALYHPEVLLMRALGGKSLHYRPYTPAEMELDNRFKKNLVGYTDGHDVATFTNVIGRLEPFIKTFDIQGVWVKP